MYYYIRTSSGVLYHCLLIVAMPAPFMPTADITDRTEEELRRLESDEREALEARIQWLRDIQTLIDSAVQQMNQYTHVSTPLTVTQADRFILMNMIVIHKVLWLPISQTPCVFIYDEYRDESCPRGDEVLIDTQAFHPAHIQGVKYSKSCCSSCFK